MSSDPVFHDPDAVVPESIPGDPVVRWPVESAGPSEPISPAPTPEDDSHGGDAGPAVAPEAPQAAPEAPETPASPEPVASDPPSPEAAATA